MAAIDKLYLNRFYEFETLRTWVIIYYPKLLKYFYDWTYSYEQYLKDKELYIKSFKRDFKKEYKKLGEFSDIEEAAQNLIKYYKENSNYDCPLDQAKEEAEAIIEHYNMNDIEIGYSHSFPVMNTPFYIDRKLKWICPLPFIRKYLHNQCGVNPRYEWLYKIFWKGKDL